VTANEFQRRFPNASRSTAKRNVEAVTEVGAPRIRSADAERNEGSPLVGAAAGEEACWHLPGGRFEITFTVFAVHPADWDNVSAKYLQDWIVKAGILPGDGWKTLSGRCLSRKAHSKEEERTEIEITQHFGPL
jgi:hypothetical protein